MTNTNVATMDELESAHAAAMTHAAAIAKQISEAREREFDSAVEKVQAWIDRYGISSDKVTFPQRPSVAKYRDPASGDTWSGKGNTPLWAKNKPLEQFVNPEWVAKQNEKERTKAEAVAKRAERDAKKAAKEAANGSKCGSQAAAADAKQVEGAASQPTVIDGTATVDAAIESAPAVSGVNERSDALGYNDAVNTPMNAFDTPRRAEHVAVADVATVQMISQ